MVDRKQVEGLSVFGFDSGDRHFVKVGESPSPLSKINIVSI